MVVPMTDRELIRAWRGLLERYHDTSCALERALNDEHQLGLSEFEVLERLLEETTAQKTECRVQELADCVHLSQSALSRVIARLERDGLITRAMCPDDRRGVKLHVTDAGRERHTRARATHRAVLAEHLAPAPRAAAKKKA